MQENFHISRFRKC